MITLQLTEDEAMHVLRLMHYGAEAVTAEISTNPTAAGMVAVGTMLDERIKHMLDVAEARKYASDQLCDSDNMTNEPVTASTPPIMLLRLSFTAPGCQLSHDLLRLYYYRKWTGVPLHASDMVQLGSPQEYLLEAPVRSVYTYSRGNITEYRCSVDNLRAAITQTRLDNIRDTLQADGWVPDMDAALSVGV